MRASTENKVTEHAYEYGNHSIRPTVIDDDYRAYLCGLAIGYGFAAIVFSDLPIHFDSLGERGHSQKNKCVCQYGDGNFDYCNGVVVIHCQLITIAGVK